MELKVYEKIIMKGAFKDTKWENMMVFLEGSAKNQSVLFSPTIDGQKLFQFEKKAPELYFIGMCNMNIKNRFSGGVLHLLSFTKNVLILLC